MSLGTAFVRVRVPLALLFAGVSAVWPLPALFALLVVLLVTVSERGRRALVVGVGGGLLSLVGTVRFTREYALKNIIHAGLLSAEDKALSRLREIQWAEGVYRKLHGRAGSLPELLTPLTARAAPVLQPQRFTVPAGTSVAFSEGFLFTVHPSGASFTAYAWPADASQNGARAFALDERDQICERDARPPSGLAELPPAEAAFRAGQPCGSGSQGDSWHGWRPRRRPRPLELSPLVSPSAPTLRPPSEGSPLPGTAPGPNAAPAPAAASDPVPAPAPAAAPDPVTTPAPAAAQNPVTIPGPIAAPPPPT
jgi:hypothetical protein